MALLGFALLLAGLGFSIMAPWGELEETRARIADAELAIQQFSQRAAKADVTSEQTQPAPTDYVIRGDSSMLAAATLQRRMSAAFTSRGGTILSSQITLPEASDGRQRVELIIGFEINPEGLQKALYDLEAQPPAMFVEQLGLHPAVQTDDGAPMRLQGSVTLSAFWKALP